MTKALSRQSRFLQNYLIRLREGSEEVSNNFRSVGTFFLLQPATSSNGDAPSPQASSHLPGIAWPTNLLTGHRSEREDLREVAVWEVPAGCLGKWGQEPRNLGILSDLSGILASPLNF